MRNLCKYKTSINAEYREILTEYFGSCTCKHTYYEPVLSYIFSSRRVTPRIIPVINMKRWYIYVLNFTGIDARRNEGLRNLQIWKKNMSFLFGYIYWKYIFPGFLSGIFKVTVGISYTSLQFLIPEKKWLNLWPVQII